MSRRQDKEGCHGNDRRRGERCPRRYGKHTGVRAPMQGYSPPNREHPSPPKSLTDYESLHGSRGGAPSPRRRGLNQDYYNPPSDECEPPQRNHHRRSRAPPRMNGGGDCIQPAPDSRSTTESCGRRRGRSSRRMRGRYESDYTDDDGASYSSAERPAKPSRRKSFLSALGIGSPNKRTGRGRVRSYRSPSRGRKGHRNHSYSPSPSPPRRHRSMRDPSRREPRERSTGLKKSNTDWQRAAASAMKAGASAAYDLRNDSSPWIGPKGIKVATAAIGAAIVDGFGHEEHQQRSEGMKHDAIKQMGEAALRHIVDSTGLRTSRSRKRH